jgi:hypothetical protein
MWYNAKLCYAFVLPDIENNLCGGKCMKTLRGVCLNLDNAPAHNAKRSRQEIARAKAARSGIRLILLVLHPVAAFCLAA